MTNGAEELKSRLETLSVRDRAELALYLIRSLDAEVTRDAEEAWDDEVARRMREIEDGTVVGIPAEIVFSEIRKKLS
ncbi:MAG: addiction module protein [Planctomycetaceae bacterium]